MTENNERTCGCHENELVCTKVTTQSAEVSLPVQVKPYAIVGQIETDCCQEPTIITRQLAGCPCSCEFVITQSISVKIPIEYGTVVDTGEVTVCCKRPSINGCGR